MTAHAETLRESNAAGPCIPLGTVIRQTSRFWIFNCRFTGEEKRRGKKFSRHTSPCSCCTDHPRTAYPDGYMD